MTDTTEDRPFAAAWKIVSAWDGKITKPVLRKAIAAAVSEARAAALEEAAKVAYDYECSLADYGDSVDAKHFYEGGVGDASIGISKAIRSLIPERKASDDLKEAEGVGR